MNGPNSHEIFIVIQNSDDPDDEIWWAVDAGLTREDAILVVEEIAEDIYNRTGSRPERLDGS